MCNTPKKTPGKFGGFEKARRQNPNREKGYRGDIAAVCAKLNTFIDMSRRTNDLVSTGLQLRPVCAALKKQRQPAGCHQALRYRIMRPGQPLLLLPAAALAGIVGSVTLSLGQKVASDKFYCIVDGKVDERTYNGFRRYNAGCNHCHGR
jgi:hypothetical protein